MKNWKACVDIHVFGNSALTLPKALIFINHEGHNPSDVVQLCVGRDAVKSMINLVVYV